MKFFKRLLCAALAAVIVCFSAVLTVGADNGSFTVTVTANRDTVSAGNTVTFLLLVEDINVEGGLLSLDIPLRFDDTVFDYAGAVPIYPTAWDYPDNFSYVNATNGLVWLRILNDGDSFTSEKGCNESGKMGFYVTLRAKRDAAVGSSAITTNGDGGFLVVSGTAADGKCTVIYGTGESATVSVSEFDGLLGDVNLDGSVDNLDAAQVLKHDAGISKLSDGGYALADVNGDGSVDTLDAAQILKLDAGIIFGF